MAEAKKDAPKRETYATDFIKGDWDKAQYLNDPHVDNLMSCVLQLGAEFWAVKRRLMVVERFLDEKKIVSKATVEAYNPTDAEKVAWNAERDDFINRVYSVLTRVSVKTGGTPPMAKVPPLNQ